MIRTYKEWCDVYVTPPSEVDRVNLILRHGRRAIEKVEKDIEWRQRIEYDRFCRENGG